MFLLTHFVLSKINDFLKESFRIKVFKTIKDIKKNVISLVQINFIYYCKQEAIHFLLINHLLIVKRLAKKLFINQIVSKLKQLLIVFKFIQFLTK